MDLRFTEKKEKNYTKLTKKKKKKKIFHTPRHAPNPAAAPNASPNYLCLPYIRELEPLRSQLRPSRLQLVFRPSNTTKSNLFRTRPRDTSPTVGVYNIPCNECPNQYIGMTGRSLEQRLKEHKRDVRTGVETNALFCHMRDAGHAIKWESAKIFFPAETST